MILPLTIVICWNAITAVATAILAATGMFALFYARSQLKQSHAQAQIQHLRDLEREFDAPPAAVYRQELAAARLDSSGKLTRLDIENPPGRMYDLLNFFEHVALLVRRGYLDPTDVWDTFSWWICNIYADARPLIVAEQQRDPEFYCDLVGLMKVFEDKRKTTESSLDEIESFYQEERPTTAERVISNRPRRKKQRK